MVGYAVPSEPVHGVVSSVVKERAYYGDVLEEMRYLAPTDKVNDDLRVSKRISIVADQFAFENFLWIKYVEWAGFLWKVETVEPQRPRLILTLGGGYDGPRA